MVKTTSESRRHTESRIRVRYKETDQMGIAHHSNHIVWFEIGRTDLCREAGLSYREIEAAGWMLVVVEVGCRYLSPFRYDDEVVIRTSIESAGSRALRFAYELCDATGSASCARGFSSHLWVDARTRRPTTVPKEIWQGFGPFLPPTVR
ncbi:MAG: thioesterase family protein [Thermoanaerobaculia bacterium]